jgi:Thiol-disulfide isomerase and thioredoxins
MPRENETKRRRIFFIPVMALVMLSAIAFAGCDSSSSGPSVTSSPKPTPEPVVVSSVPQSLEQFRGKVIVLDLWATWCGPCKAEIPGFIRLQNKYRDQGLEIVGVSLDPVTRGGNAQMVSSFVRSNAINYTIWLVNDAAALSQYPVIRNGIPTTYIIDRQGRTVRQYVGAQSEVTFETDIKSLL